MNSVANRDVVGSRPPSREGTGPLDRL